MRSTHGLVTRPSWTWLSLSLACLTMQACEERANPPPRALSAASRPAEPVTPEPAAPIQSVASAPAGGALQLVIDQSLAQISSPFDASFDGIGPAIAMLRRHGARVSINNRPLERFLATFRGEGRVLLLGIAWNERYSEAAIDAIERFVDSGGGVLVLAEHDNTYGNAEVQAPLTRRFGIVPLHGRGEAKQVTPANNQRRWPLCHVKRWGLKRVRMYWPGPLRVSAPAQPLMRIADPADPDAALVAALNTARKGRFVVLADLEILWAMTPELGSRGDDNPAFLRRLFGLLAGRERALEPQPIIPHLEAAWREGDKRALFETSGLGLVPDGAASGLERLAAHLHRRGFRIEAGGGRGYDYSAVDLAVVVSPQEPLAWPRGIRHAKKILLVGDGRTDLLEALPVLMKPLGLDTHEQPPYPLNRLARPLGVEFEQVTLIDAGDSFHVAARLEDGKALPRLHRSSTLRVLGEACAGCRVVAHAAAGTIPTRNLIPAHTTDKLADIPRRKPARGTRAEAAARRWPVVVASPRLMAVADLELVTDQTLARKEAKAWLRALDTWLIDGRPRFPDMRQ